MKLCVEPVEVELQFPMFPLPGCFLSLAFFTSKKSAQDVMRFLARMRNWEFRQHLPQKTLYNDESWEASEKIESKTAALISKKEISEFVWLEPQNQSSFVLVIPCLWPCHYQWNNNLYSFRVQNGTGIHQSHIHIWKFVKLCSRDRQCRHKVASCPSLQPSYSPR